MELEGNKKKQSLYIILSVIILSLLMTFIDGFINPVYAIKVIIKCILFLLVPIMYFILNKEERGSFKKLFKPKLKTLIKAAIIGVLIYTLIIGGYFLTRGFIDYSGITNSLTSNNGINAENFVFVSLYISLMNSLLEEFFFRGFGFIALKGSTGRLFAYIFSSAMFAVYHIGMLMGMFAWWVIPILFVGLFLGGCIFNYLNETSENIYTSWACHMFANFAINTVGFILFGII